MLEKKYKGLILTVGAQSEQVKFSIKNICPKYIGILGTNTSGCKEAIEKIFKEISFCPTNIRIEYVEDKPESIKDIILKFDEIYNWFNKTHNLEDREIVVDPTGGRKWMSAGIIMIASFRGIDLVYVDAPFINGKPDSSKMDLVPITNAYENVGFLEESKADKLFNSYSFIEATNIYKFLEEKLTDPRRVTIKRLISESYFYWTQFKFNKAFESLNEVLRKINQFNLLNEYKNHLEEHLQILKILKKNDEPQTSYFSLIKDDMFSEKMLLFLLSQSERYAENKYYDLAVILLYRILEGISQIRLAKHNIDTNKISEQTKEKYNDRFREITREVFGGESEIPTKIALLHGWILLYCLGDFLTEGENIKLKQEMLI
ncbi:MAG: TIGR02710 family CRISPR-associated CARF protein [bacterium]|nr:TIGR02710 family CRISPR-associated CARF protein [bacterium]